MEVVLARLEAVDQRVRELKADIKADAAEKHAQNVERLERIEDQVRQTNGRVSVAESQIRGLWARAKEIAHDVARLARAPHASGDGEDQHVSLRTVGIWVGIAVTCIGGTFWFVIDVLKWGPLP